ncbi:MAG: substrate-binding domain-containing protein [Thermoanaerobaculia bacterium]
MPARKYARAGSPGAASEAGGVARDPDPRRARRARRGGRRQGDAGVVYTAGAAANPGVEVALVVPEDGPTIVYPAAVVASSRRIAEAERLLAYLASPPAQEVFARFGFQAHDSVDSPPWRPTGSGSSLHPRRRGDRDPAHPAARHRARTPARPAVSARSRWRHRHRSACPAMVAAGLVLLRLFGRPRAHWRGARTWVGLEVVFTWRSVVVAMAVMAHAAPRPRSTRRLRGGAAAARGGGALDRRLLEPGLLPRHPAARETRGSSAAPSWRSPERWANSAATILVAGNLRAAPRCCRRRSSSSRNGEDPRALRLLAGAVVLAFAAVAASEALLRRKGPHRP